jgi:hypothetical protein
MTMSGPKVARRRATVDTESDGAVDSHIIDSSTPSPVQTLVAGADLS